MTSTKNETSEIERKLQELASFYKYEPEKSTMREIVASFRATSQISSSLKECLANSRIPHLLIKFNSTKKHIFVFDLAYLCLVYEIYTKEDIFKLIESMWKQSWDLPFKMKILQMSFYFVRFDLSFEMCFKLLSMVIESFVVEDPSIDLISRPVVCQVIERILSKSISENGRYTDGAGTMESDGNLSEYEHPRRLFEFLRDNIVCKKRTFPSYILLIIMKFPNIEKHPMFAAFLEDCFVECSLVVFDKGRNDDKIPVFEAILKVERSFSSTVSLERFFDHFPSIYEKSPRCDLMLRFLSCLFPIRAELLRFPFPPQLSNILVSFVKSTDFSLTGSESFLRFFTDIVKHLRIEFEANEVIGIIFDKIGGTSSATMDISTLYFNSLSYCAKNDLRGLFDKGLVCGYACKRESLKARSEHEKSKGRKATPEKPGGMGEGANACTNAEEIKHYCIQDIDTFVFDIKDYMGPSWGIYFDNNSIYELARLREFSEKHLESFIDAMPHGTDLPLIVFENSTHIFQVDKASRTDNIGLSLFEKLLYKICDCKTLFEIILRFYSLNNEDAADPGPLNILLRYLKNKTVESDESLLMANEFKDLIKSLDHRDASTNKRLTSLQLVGSSTTPVRFGSTTGFLQNDAGCQQINADRGSCNTMGATEKAGCYYSEPSEEVALSKLQGPIVKDLYTFLSRMIETVKLERCWDEVFSLLGVGCGFLDEKLNIILQVEHSFISVLNEEYLGLLYYCLTESFMELIESERKNAGSTKEEGLSVEQTCAKILEAFGILVNHLSSSFRTTRTWRKAILFFLEIILSDRHTVNARQNGSGAPGTSLDALSWYFLEMFFDVFNSCYRELQESEVSFLSEVLSIILHEMKSREIVLKTLTHLASLLNKFILRPRMDEFVEHITKLVCGEDEDIAAASFATLKTISCKIKAEILPQDRRETDVQLHGSKTTAGHAVEKRVVLKYKGKKRKNRTGKNLAAGLEESDKDSRMAFEKEKIDFNALNSAKDTELTSTRGNSHCTDSAIMETRVFGKRLADILINSFKEILSKCNPLRYSIISQVFLEIPSFVFNAIEIASLSEYLKKYVDMPEPFRTNAVDCFIKTCSGSRQFSFCLEILSSWLSENSKETSLSLISKIGENLQREDFSKLAGLSNFLDYSLQFCRSDDFLEPVLDLVAKCECSFDIPTIEKLIRFSQTFVDGQMEVRYAIAREETLINYVVFIANVVRQEDAGCTNRNCSKVANGCQRGESSFVQLFLDMLIGITRKKAPYLKLKLKCFDILFHGHSFSKDVLKEELKRVFSNLTANFLRQGLGISSYSIMELHHVLQLLIDSCNVDLVDSLKLELTGLLLIRDYKIVDYVRILLKEVFMSEK